MQANVHYFILNAFWNLQGQCHKTKTAQEQAITKVNSQINLICQVTASLLKLLFQTAAMVSLTIMAFSKHPDV